MDEIPYSDSGASPFEEDDPEEAAESRMVLIIISALFGTVVLFIVVSALYFVARDKCDRGDHR